MGRLEKLRHKHRLPSGRGNRPLKRALGSGTGFSHLKRHTGDAPDIPFYRETYRIHVCICFVAYKLYKELERIIHMMNLGLSVDTVIDIAKTIPTLVLELPDGQKITRTIFNTRDQQSIRSLFLNS